MEYSQYSTSLSPGSITCPQCRTVLSYYDRAKSSFFACPHCGAFFQRDNGVPIILRTFSAEDMESPAFPLGTTGFIDGSEYVLVGFMTKKEDSDDVYWNEYAFYSPGSNWYLMLAEYDGHWMIIRRSDNQDIEVKTMALRELAFDETGRSFELYLSYKFFVVNAQGEFDWNVLDDEELVTYEYVSAPVLLINEWHGNKSSWFRARYVSPRRLLSSFHVNPRLMPERTGFRPATFYARWKPMLIFTGIMIALLVLVNVIAYIGKPSQPVYTGTVDCEPDTSSPGNFKPFITPAFAITHTSAVKIAIEAARLENSWLQAGIVLINDNTGRVYEVNKTLEYYHGSDDGESWSEGDWQSDAILSHVPAGTYHMNIYPATEVRDGVEPPLLNVSVNQDVFLGINFWLMLLAIITWPVIQFIRRYYYENSKWFSKDYGTYPKE